MARILLCAIITLFSVNSFAQSNCEAYYQYTLGLCPNILFFSNVPTDQINNTTFHWDFGDGSTSGEASPDHTYTSSGFYEVCLTIERNGCTSTYCDLIPVQCIPDGNCHAGFEYYPSTACGVLQFYDRSFTTTPNWNYEFVWSFGDGSGDNNNHNPVHTYTQNGEYEVCISIVTANGCADTYCETVVVDCFPDPPVCETAFQYTLGQCPTVQFFGASTTPPPGTAANWQWDFGDGTSGTGYNPEHTYTANGTYTVCLIATFPDGCVADYCQTLNIQCIPECDTYFDYTLGNCPSVTFYGANSTPPPANTSWHWEFGDGTSATGPNPVHTYTHNGTYTVCLTTTDPLGCTAEYCESIVIDCIPPPCEAFYQYTLGACPEIYFFGNSNTIANPISWDWDFGDGHTADVQNPVHTYEENGTYTVCLTITSANGCVDEFCSDIIITCIPDCAVAFEYDDADCPTIRFTGATTAPPPPGDPYWIWDFGDGTTGTGPDPEHTYTENGIYIVCLTVYNPFGCQATYCEELFIDCVPPTCAVGFQYTLATCPEVQFFAGASVPPNSTILEWDFGDGTTSPELNPTHTYQANGTYTVCLTAIYGDGCVAEHCETITINCIPPSCEAFFEYTLDRCPVVEFFSANTNPPPGTNAWHWDFGDGTTGYGPNPVHTYADNGFYEVCLTVSYSTNCSDTYCETVPIKCIPTGVNDDLQHSLKVYPNPATDVLNIHWERTDVALYLMLYAFDGRLVSTWKIADQADPVISLEDLPSGMYLLKMRSGDAESTIKLIRQ